MLGLFNRKKSTANQIRQEKEKRLNEMIERSSTLKRLIANDKAGWREFCSILSGYIDAIKKRKAVTALDRADEATIKELMLLDHEVYILKFVLQMPQQFIDKTEGAVNQVNREDTNAVE